LFTPCSPAEKQQKSSRKAAEKQQKLSKKGEKNASSGHS
jgi:hypothetical protein